MSEKYLQATEGSQHPTSQQNITIKPLPPGTCCARCDRPSHVASKEASNPCEGDQRGEPFSQIRQLKSKVSVGSARVSDFFSQLRQDGSFDGGKIWKSDGKRESTRKERASDFFATMRQLNHDDEEAQNDTPLEETDFFAQVREMIATEDDSDEAAIQRASDFFEQIRQMSHEGEEEDGCPICEDCQVQDQVHENLDNNVHVQLSQSNVGSFLADRKGAASDDDGQSPRSGISGLLSRGRKSIATGINAISEKGSQVASNPGQAREILGNVMPGRVGDFLQRLQGRNEQGASKVDVATTQKVEEKINVQSIPEGSLLEGNKFQSMDREMLPYDGLNDIEAMAVYRKSQELKRQFSPVDDDASSHSSFHTLPTNIREVVKSRGSSPAKPARAVSTSPPQAGLDTANPGTRIKVSGQKVEPTTPVVFSSSSPLSPTPDTHENIIRNSPLLVGALDQGIIDTDGTTSDASYSGMDPSALASLMMSPDLLQKRLHQAVRAAESRRWDQLQYLLNANPWLAEMSELTTDQFLLHKIAFFGKSAPAALCEHILNMFPSAVYKFDQDGNVPLHLAAAAGHLKMIRLLGDRFEGGASIRNEDGMLPLHFTIASYGDYSGIYGEEEDYDENDSSPLTVIKTVLKFFPKAVAIGDNDGNLPIHVAAECLLDDFGVDVVYILLDAADRQLQAPDGARFYNKVKLEDKVNEDISAGTVKTDSETTSAIDDEDIHCSMVKNEFGETPLLAAVRCRRGWDVIEALVSGPGGHVAALYEDAEGNTALHLLVGEYEDPAAAMSILKIAPMAASVRNSGGMLPIEIACLRSMPPEVVLAIGLVDLPFDIDEKEVVITREDCGGSWWFLACECDDHYADIVQQIIMICTFQQARQLSFWKGGPRKQKQTVLSRATPKCKQVLQHALRFLGRFEIIGDGPLHCDEVSGVTVFDALDFMDSVNEGGRRVTLKCYSTEDSFSNTIALLHDLALDPAYVEEIEIVRGESIPRQFCLVIESPQATLNRVVNGMMKKPGYQNDTILRKKYAAKICAVLRFVAKSVRQLHRSGAVHGNLCLENCGKFQHSSWKLLDSTGIVKLGDSIEPTRFGKSFPPESLHLAEEAGAVFDSDNPAVKFLAMPAGIAVDIWAFGKLAYEALVGRPLVDFDKTKLPSEDTISMLEILEWDQASMKRIFTDLLESGVTDTCAELVTSCLFPNPEDRPKSMDIILEDPFWKDMRQFRERSSPSKRSTTSSGFTEATSKSLLTENASVNTSIETDRAEI